MRKRLVRALVFAAVALGVAVGAAGAAGALDSGHPGAERIAPNGSVWD